jgi:hypothetical protein
MFDRTWRFWIEKYKTVYPNYNIDSARDAIDLPHITIFPASVLTSDDEPHSPPSWEQVHRQFNYAQDCASGSAHDEHFVHIQRQAFVTLWTLHAVSNWQRH